MLIPHYYQFDAIDSIFNYFEVNSGNPIVAMPTATGKSIVIAGFLRKAFYYYPNQKALVLTHVKELVDQNFARFKNMWPDAPAGVNSAGLKRRDLHFPILFAGLKSIIGHLEKLGKIDLILIDEAHLVSDIESSQYIKIISFLTLVNPKLKVIGFTATAFRTGMGCLTEGGIFTDFCIDLTTSEWYSRFIAEGFLTPLVPKRMNTLLDISGVHMRGGDFNLSELQTAVDKESITNAALLEVLEHGKDRNKWLIFGAGVNHAIHISEALTNLGVPCGVVHSKMSIEERDSTLDKFDNGDLQALANNGILTTGYDNPKIDLLVFLRHTVSIGLWKQMLGRGTRPLYAKGHDLRTLEGRLTALEKGGKPDTLVLDFAKNTARLGPIDCNKIPKKGEKTGQAPMKECGGCDNFIFAGLMICPHCGYEFPVSVKIETTSGSDELISTDIPKVKIFKVDHISYAPHTPFGKPPMIAVSYYCGRRVFKNIICPMHNEKSYPYTKAWKFLRKHGLKYKYFPSINDVLDIAEQLLVPTHIRVWTNKPRYPEVMDYCFDGLAFNTETEKIGSPLVQIENIRIPCAPIEKDSMEQPIEKFEDYDDSIPF